MEFWCVLIVQVSIGDLGLIPALSDQSISMICCLKRSERDKMMLEISGNKAFREYMDIFNLNEEQIKYKYNSIAADVYRKNAF